MDVNLRLLLPLGALAPSSNIVNEIWVLANELVDELRQNVD